MGELLMAAPKNKGANGSTFTGHKREPVKGTAPELHGQVLAGQVAGRRLADGRGQVVAGEVLRVPTQT
jgi:hypothetical protein